MEFNLTEEEKSAIRKLKRLSKTWPNSLWLCSASGTLCVMRKSENGGCAYGGNNPSPNGVDPDMVVTTIYGIDNDGGDW